MNRLWGGTRTLSREGREETAEAKTNPEPDVETVSAPASEGDSETSASASPENEDDSPSEEPHSTRRSRFTDGTWARIGVVGVAVVLLVTGAGFLYEAHRVRSTPSAENHALTDTEATNRVAGDVDNALARIFSYTPKGTDATERSARSVLTGRAARQYGELFDRVRSDLADQKVSLTTVAVRTGVVELHGTTAKLLVFLDQTSRRGDAKESYAAAQLAVTARFENDGWRIADIQTR